MAPTTQVSTGWQKVAEHIVADLLEQLTLFGDEELAGDTPNDPDHPRP
jgi:hypothetical protein